MTSNAPLIDTVYHDLALRTLEVIRVTRVTPRLVRVTLGGPELAGFIDRAPADHVKAFFPAPGQLEPVLPLLGDDDEGLIFPDVPPFPISRDYTTRRFDPVAGELDLDFVLHGSGVASVWAAQAAPGQKLGLAGPRGSVMVPLEFDWYLLASDETGLPGLSRYLEILPEGAIAKVFILVDDAGEEHHLETKADAAITWVHRDGLAHGEGDLLHRAISALEFPPGRPYVWITGEAGELKPIRRHLRAAGFDRDYTDVDGYWKRGTVNLDHHLADDDEEEPGADAAS
ncbi:siderophore-interacting protein [Kitasatospora sp. NPDC002965]|uniref:siderophore-interacting protein n=1 Tax=unclassified Kitasatospora TaxID=2633591 RepID=UPI0033BB167E